MTEIGDALWLHLRGAVERVDQVPRALESVFGLRSNEFQELVAAHLLVGGIASEAVAAAKNVLESMPGTVIRVREDRPSAVTLPVRWPETLILRSVTRDPTRIVTSPPRRHYQTPLAVLVKTALATVGDLGSKLGDRDIGTARNPADRTLGEARTLLGHAKLAEVEQLTLPPRTIERFETRPATAALARLIRLARDALSFGEEKVVRGVVNSQVLAPAADDTLYEFLVGTRLTATLERIGFARARTHLLPHNQNLLFQGQRGRQVMTVWWQRSLTGVIPYISRYRLALEAAGLVPSALRPDLVLRSENPDAVLLVEIKYSEMEGASPDRVGLREMLSYAYDAESTLRDLPTPRGLIVAARSSGLPADHDFLIIDESRIDDAIRIVDRAWLESSVPVEV